MAREYVDIEPEVWKPVNPGDFTEGEFIKTNEKVGSHDSKMHCFRGDDGKEFTVWGSTLIDDRMDYVKPGDFVRIIYKETTQNQKGQPLKIYKIGIAKAKPGKDETGIPEETVVAQ